MAQTNLDVEKTKKLHYILQHKMFEHCDDYENLEDLDDAKTREHCERCEYYSLCQFSNNLTAFLTFGRVTF